MTGLLIAFATQKGYGLTYSQTHRPNWVAKEYARRGIGILNSLHGKRLAVDFNLFIDGKYMRDTEDYRVLGEFWESIGGTWGGRFNDGNHFSLSHNGVK